MSKISNYAIASTLIFATAAMSAFATNGFYAGARAGWANLGGKGKADQTVAGTLRSNKFKPSKSGFVADIFAGHEWAISSGLLVGGEAFVGLNTAKYKKTSTNLAALQPVRDTLTQKYKVGVSLNVGTPLSPSISLYGKLGILNSRFNIKDQPSSGLGYSPSSKAKNLWGIEPGVRLKVEMNREWSSHLDVNYAFYQNFKSENFSTVVGNSYVVTVRPRVFSILAGVAYKF